MCFLELLSPKIDVVFKSLFSYEESRDILSDFIAAVLDIDVNDIKEINVLSGEMLPDIAEHKNAYLDITLNVNDSLINIEMQLTNLSDFRERILYYWSKLYTRDLKRGESYRKLKQTISINILDFNMFECESYHSVFRLRADDRDEILTDKCRFDFLELPKAAAADNSRQISRLRRWMRFFNLKNEEEAKMLAENNEVMSKAVFILKQMSEDEKMREIARIRERALHDEASYREDIAEAEKKARAEGEKQKEKTIVFNMFKTNQTNSLISTVTGLSDSEIEKYRQEYLLNNIHNF